MRYLVLALGFQMAVILVLCLLLWRAGRVEGAARKVCVAVLTQQEMRMEELLRATRQELHSCERKVIPRKLDPEDRLASTR